VRRLQLNHCVLDSIVMFPTLPTTNRVSRYLITHHLPYIRCRLLLSDQPRLTVAGTKTRIMPYSDSRPSTRPDLHPTLNISLSRVPLRPNQPATFPAANLRFDPPSSVHRYIISRRVNRYSYGHILSVGFKSRGFMMQQCKKSPAT